MPLLPVNENAPVPPRLTLLIVTRGTGALVTVHAMVLLVPTAAALRVNELPDTVAVPPTPMPVHATPDSLQSVGSVSVIVVAVPALVSTCGAPVTPVPADVVAMVWLAQPLLPVKVKLPVPLLDTLVNVSDRHSTLKLAVALLFAVLISMKPSVAEKSAEAVFPMAAPHVALGSSTPLMVKVSAPPGASV